ncbi:MAG: hypothetical protein KDA63_08295, partial [Planctomycetales bacterium]|nr:hypothetical protein [Planctomycetales bacterium]
VATALRQESPAVYLSDALAWQGVLVADPACLREGEADVVRDRLVRLLSRKAAPTDTPRPFVKNSAWRLQAMVWRY